MGDTSATSGLATYVDNSLRIQAPQKSPNVLRYEKIARTQDNSYSTNGNNIVRFNLPLENIDFSRSYLETTITLTATGGTYKRLSQGAWCTIYRTRVVIGAVEHETQYYNRLMSLHWNTTASLDVESSIGQDLLGIGTQADRNSYGAAPTEFIIPLRIGLLNGILPLKELCTPQNGQIAFVELTLENPLSCVETNGTNPQFTLSNTKWHYHQVVSEDGSYERSIASAIAQGNVRFGFDSWNIYQNSVINSNNDLQIQWKGSSLNSIVTMLVDASSLNNPAVNDKFTTWLKTVGPGSSVFQFQHQLNTNWVPQEAILCDGFANRAYMQYLNWQGLWRSDAFMKFPSPIDLTTFNASSFLMVGDFHALPRNVIKLISEDREPFNNLSTRNNGVNTILRMELTGPPPAQIVAYHCISYGTVINIDSRGVLRKSV